tara:strand:+ start:1782 stop:2885 length:1104 start_codon:yes stop_codon:yes gene_type:complete
MSELNQFNNIRPNPNEEVKELSSYSAPLENRRDLLRLDFNENTLGPSPKVFKAIKNIKINELSIYPEYNFLKHKLCNHYILGREFDIDEIGIFNGADAAINAIFKTFGEKNKVFLTTNPTFGYYFPCAEMQGMRIKLYSYIGKNFTFPIDNFNKGIKKYDPKLIFICNPNNPTGSVISAEEIIEIANQNKKTLIVIDELYEKFYGDSLLPIIDFKEIKNIVVIHSLSKTAGLAGLRIGFAFGNSEIIKYINKVTGPYDVNSFAVAAAIAALDDQEYIINYISKVKEARTWIKEKFKSLNIRSNFNGGNYFLIWPNKKPQLLEKEMRNNGILIRSMENKKDIDLSVRVSIGIKEQMKLFWEVYKKLDQ